ncbi:MAG TPA: glycosyltransferase family 9 protein [Phycisphaerales bacterium]|nr:glycosyltransferase family 9 protein [Phycisphaerales bacterium]
MATGSPSPISQQPPPRVLIYLPSWLGDTVMATPAMALVRHALPRSVLVALGRPGMNELLSGLDWIDDVLIADGRSTLGPAKVAARLRAMRLDAALLLPNSFSSALTVRLAGIERRVGYDRDGRGAFLTHKLDPLKRPAPHKGYQPMSAVDYYLDAARALLVALHATPAQEPPARLLLATTLPEERLADEVLAKGGIGPQEPFALLNPGGNNPAKRWPVERFAALAHHLITVHKLKVAINGSPAESELVGTIQQAIELNHPEDGNRVACLPELGGTIGSLKATLKRARVMVTNDTGPRHIAAAFNTPTVALFGPTDPRWTTLPLSFTRPGVPREVVLVADPTLPPQEVADDHPSRCAIEGIGLGDVVAAVDRVLAH